MATNQVSTGLSAGLQGIGLNSPEFDPSKKIPAKPPVRAVKDEQQAAQVCAKLVNDASEQNIKNRRIMAKYNAEKPFRQQELDNDGLGWKTNISTQPLASLVDRISPRFERAVGSVKYLTSSKLPDNVPGASKKTDAFRKEITDLFRAREGWGDLVGDIAQESALFGFTSAACVDEYCWFPAHFRQDRFFVPAFTKQTADDAEVVLLIEQYKPFELVEILKDRQAAEDAGWDFANTVEAVNRAMPQNLRSGFSDHSRIYEDLQREANVAVGYYDSARIVEVYSLYVREATGKISHWRLNNNPGTSQWRLLFRREDRYDNFRDFITFFSFQKANGTLRGSKGVGRIVYDMAGVIDRTRNEVIDRLQLSGKVIMSGDEKEISRFRMSVFGNAILVGSQFDIQQKSIDPQIEEFLQMDTFLTMILNEQAGNVTPRQLEGERVTKAAVDVFTAREEEAKDNPIERFLMQMSRLVSMCQRRAMDPKCDEPDAKAARKRLLDIMSEEELKQLAESPSAGVVRDLTDQERQRIILVATENAGNPVVNQEEMTRRKLTAQLGAEFAEAVMLPANDPTVAAEQSRFQQLENILLSIGQTVPVSQRDNHLIHLDTLMAAIEQGLQAAMEDASATETIKGMLQHGMEHVQVAVAMGEKAAVAQHQAKLNEIAGRIAQLDAHDQAVADAVNAGVPPDQISQAGQEAAVAASPDAVNAAPPSAAPPVV